MFTINENILRRHIKDDLPYYDLTTSLQKDTQKDGNLKIFTREKIVMTSSYEVQKIAQILGCKVEFCLEDKQIANPKDTLLKLSGTYENLHHAWRNAQAILEYGCKMATYTHEFVQNIRSINPSCELLATRKSFPFAKEFCIKSIITGGGMIHRLNLSETVLFFDNHRILYEDDASFYKDIITFKTKVPEKKIVVESKSYEDAIALMDHSVDVIQTDKLHSRTLEKLVNYKNEHHPSIKILAAGGINKDNAKEFVKTGVDAIITSSIYSAGIADLSCKISLA